MIIRLRGRLGRWHYTDLWVTYLEYNSLFVNQKHGVAINIRSLAKAEITLTIVVDKLV